MWTSPQHYMDVNSTLKHPLKNAMWTSVQRSMLALKNFHIHPLGNRHPTLYVRCWCWHTVWCWHNITATIFAHWEALGLSQLSRHAWNMAKRDNISFFPCLEMLRSIATGGNSWGKYCQNSKVHNSKLALAEVIVTSPGHGLYKIPAQSVSWPPTSFLMS